MLDALDLLRRLASAGPFPWHWPVHVELSESLRGPFDVQRMFWPEPEDDHLIVLEMDRVVAPISERDPPALRLAEVGTPELFREHLASSSNDGVSTILVATFELSPELAAEVMRDPLIRVICAAGRSRDVVLLEMARALEWLVHDRLYRDLIAFCELQVALLGFLSGCAEPRTAQSERAVNADDEEPDEVAQALLDVSLGAHVRLALGFGRARLKNARDELGACPDTLRKYRRLLSPGLRLARDYLAALAGASPRPAVQLDLFRRQRSEGETVVRALRADQRAFGVPGIGDPTRSLAQVERSCYATALALEGNCATRAAARLGVTKNTVLQNRPASRRTPRRKPRRAS